MKKYFLIFLIIAVGFFLRIYNIDHTPPGIYPDEAVNAIDAINANNSGQYQWFYTANQGREGLFMNLVALFFKLFGISILTLKLPAILSGTLTIGGVYLLSKELFQRERAGLITAALTAFSFWAINFSRISFRASMLPLVLVFSFYFLFKTVRTNRWYFAASAGLIFGLGVHTYIAFRIAPAILAILLISFMLSRENFIKNYWKNILVFIFFTAIASFPILYTFYAHPEYFDSRSDAVSIFSPRINQGNLAGTFAKTLSLSLLKYNFWGDQNWRHNYPPYPILDPLAGIAFLFGLIYAFIKLFHFSYLRFSQKIRDSELDTYVLLLSWFFIMLSPEFLTDEGLPHALRSIGTLPAVFLIATLTFEFFLESAKNRTLIFKKVTATLIVLMIASIGAFNSIKYHYFWARKEKVALSFNKNLTDAGRYIKSLPASYERYVITSYNTLEKLPIFIFNTDTPKLYYFYPNELDKINPQNEDRLVIIFTERNIEAIDTLRARFPRLKLEEKRNDPGSIYYILK